MIQVIFGKKGSGKTKRLIDLANDSLKEQKGDVLFIDDDNRYMFDLRHEIRFINAGEYFIHTAEMFYGFVCGLLAQNFDASLLFVDAFLKLTCANIADLEWLFEKLTLLCERHEVRLVISISGDPATMPAYIAPYVI